MSRRKRQTLSPTLFPFLAVLVCTLGTLILFLAMVAQKSKDTAKAKQEQLAAERAEAPYQLTAMSVDQLIDEEQFRADQLVSFRDQQTENIDQQRTQLAHLDDHLQRLKEQLNRLRDEVNAATSDDSADDVPTQTLVMLREQLNDEAVAVQELAETVDSKQPRVVIVPHKGPNGTDRRPIYLECTSTGVTIWPEGVEVSNTQLDSTARDANPLEAALQTIRFHALQHYGDGVAPYPLLVVRPDGIRSYVMARTAMQDWDDQFGYELVSADIQLAFLAPDPELKSRIEIAVRQATIKQDALQTIARTSRGGGYGRQPIEGGYSNNRGVPYGSRGGLNPGSPARRRKPLPTLSASELGRQARTSGYQSFDRGFGSGLHDSRNEIDRMLNTMQSDSQQADLQNQLESRLGLSGQSSSEDSSQPWNQEGSQRVASTERADDTLSMTLAKPDQSGEPSSQAELTSNRSDPPSLALSRSTSSGNTAGASQSGQSMSGGSPSRPSSMSLPQPGADPARQAAATPQASRQRSRENLVRREGDNWALPSSLAGIKGTAMVRTIKVQCYSDRLILIPPASGGATEVFTFLGGDIERATLQLATAVRDRVSGWGATLPGGRWQPRLQIEVMPLADERFYQLRTLMAGSGVEIAGVRGQ